MRIALASLVTMVLISCSSPQQAKHEASMNSLIGPFERITAQEAAKRVAQCGLGPVTTRHDKDLDEDLLIATNTKSATDEQLACAEKAVSYYTLELTPTVQPHYDALREARFDAWFKDEARAWLSARGLLNRVPKYQQGVTDDGVFTRQVEGLCGPQTNGAFQSKYGFHALRPEWIRQLGVPTNRQAIETMSCLTSATRVAGFKGHFIG